MIRYFKNSHADFDVPAPLAVCAVLLAAALTKGGHSGWAIGGLFCLYILYLAIPTLQRRTTGDPAPYHT